jgi:dihydroorotate dehydrogenase (NAD+) catalytic subunit
VIIQTGAAQAFVVEVKAKRAYEMQTAAGVGAQAYDIARIRGNLRSIKNDVEHASKIPGDSPSRCSAATHRIPKGPQLNGKPVDVGRLKVDFCGLDFQTPLVLLSGCVGFGEEYTRVSGFSNRDAGAVCLKGTTGAPRLGNAPHRVFETPDGMLNAIGLQNPGVDVVVEDILPQLDFSETRFIANVSGSTIEEYRNVTARFEDSAIDAIEINISCPNVREGGVAFGNDPDMSARVVEACRLVTRKPLITKLSPNQTDIAENARRCLEAGSDAFAVINTLMGMAIDIETRTPQIGSNQGGLSGPAIKPIALLKVHQVFQVTRAHGVPIIGQGGIASAADAIEFLLAGATAVGIGTALFYDPLILPKINQGIIDYLDRHQMDSVGQLTGALMLNTPRSNGSCRR